MTDYEINAFHRAKGRRVVVEYVVIDQSRLNQANQKYFPDASKSEFVLVDSKILEGTNILDDYKEVMRLCKTYVADPEIFALCREIEKRISEILEARFLIFGRDRWKFEDLPLTLRNDTKEDSV